MHSHIAGDDRRFSAGSFEEAPRNPVGASSLDLCCAFRPT
jgi:hypothetical protein